MYKFDSEFAEGLGISYGGCVRDLVRFTAGEAANATKAPLPFFRFLNPDATRGFNALWSAMLEALGILAALTESEEYRRDEKLLKKTIFNMRHVVDDALTERMLSQLTPENAARYKDVHKELLKEAQKPDAKKADLADLFLRLLHDQKYDKLSERTKVETLKHVSLAYDTFRRVYYVEVAHFEVRTGLVKPEDNKDTKKK